MQANSCSDYLTARDYNRITDEVAEYESLHAADMLPDLGLLSLEARAEFAQAIISRIDGIHTDEYKR